MEDNQNNSNYASLYSLIELLNEATGRDYSSKKALVSEWLLDAERFIDTYKQFEEVFDYPIDIQRYQGKLPPGCFKVTTANYCIMNGVCSCGQSPCICHNCTCGFTTPNHTTLSSGGATQNLCSCGAYFYKQKTRDWKRSGCFLLVPFPTGSATIDFIKIPTDSEGLPLVNEDHRNAILHYCIYQFINSQYILGRIRADVLDRQFARWTDLCAQARGSDNMPNEDRSSYAAFINNSPDKFRRRF